MASLGWQGQVQGMNELQTGRADRLRRLSSLQLTAEQCMQGRKSLRAGERTTRKEQEKRFPEITQGSE